MKYKRVELSNDIDALRHGIRISKQLENAIPLIFETKKGYKIKQFGKTRYIYGKQATAIKLCCKNGLGYPIL